MLFRESKAIMSSPCSIHLRFTLLFFVADLSPSPFCLVSKACRNPRILLNLVSHRQATGQQQSNKNPNTVKLGIPLGPAFVGGGVRSEMKCRQSDGFYRAFSQKGTVVREGKSSGLTFYLFDAFIALHELSLSFICSPLCSCTGP